MRIFQTLIVSIFLSFLPSDSQAITIVCPQDYYLDCFDEIWTLEIYGSAHYIENGVQYDAGQPDVDYNLNTCNTGHITRTWTVLDQYSNPHSCVQSIYVNAGEFSLSDIVWPKDDLQVEGCNANIEPGNLPFDYQRPTWNYVACSRVASSFRDQVFDFGPDCTKIIRTWTVINWCTYTGGSEGIYTYRQTIKVSQNEIPRLDCVPEISVQSLDCDQSFVGVPLARVTGEACNGSYVVTHDYEDAVSETNPSGIYPIGTTVVTFTVEYACGSKLTCQTTVRVTPPGPVPYCLADLNVALMGQDTDLDGINDAGMVEVWAQDVDFGSFHPCNNRALQVSFSADVTDNVRTYTCDDLGINTVELWVTDEMGNQTFCLANINVQNNGSNITDCTPGLASLNIVYGTTLDDQEEALEDVIITAKDRLPIYEYATGIVENVEYVVVDSFINQAGSVIYIENTVTTMDTVIVDSFPRINVHYLYSDDRGVFISNAVPINRNYEFTAYKADDAYRVNTEDLALLESVVFNNGTFSNPYSYLAADVNEDKQIDESDYAILSELVSREEDEWPLERQWVLYDKNNIDDTSENMLETDMQEVINISSLRSTGNRLNFMGILKGDISKYESISELHNIKVEYREQLYNTDLEIYPNPISDKINITGPEDQEIVLQLFSLDGKQVLSKKISSNTSLNVKANGLSDGIYIYSLLVETGETKTGKLQIINE